MNYSFEYIDIILLAMIAGFIFLRLRGILGKKLVMKRILHRVFLMISLKKTPEKKLDANTFDDKEQKEFLKGANIAYETIITSFSNGDVKKFNIF